MTYKTINEVPEKEVQQNQVQLVFVQENEVATDSLTIAEMFDKKHDNVLRDIRKQIEYVGEEFSLLNFVESNYINRGKAYPKYNLTEEAFTLVAMSYSTKEAVQMKIKFIQEFKRMKEHIQNQQQPFKLPTTYKEALLQLVEKEEENERLQLSIEQNKPKVLFADSVSASHTSILVGELAKLLKQSGIETGAKRLFAYLRDNGYLIKRKGTDYNMQTQKSMERKLFEIKETSVTHSDGHISISKTPKVTGKGQVYFINKFLNKKRRSLA